MRPDDDQNDFAHLPTVDEAKLAKQDLWRRAKEAAEQRRAPQAPAPVSHVPPQQQYTEPPAPAPAAAPKRKIKVRLKTPPGARAAEPEESWTLPEEAFEPAPQEPAFEEPYFEQPAPQEEEALPETAEQQPSFLAPEQEPEPALEPKPAARETVQAPETPKPLTKKAAAAAQTTEPEAKEDKTADSTEPATQGKVSSSQPQKKSGKKAARAETAASSTTNETEAKDRATESPAASQSPTDAPASTDGQSPVTMVMVDGVLVEAPLNPEDQTPFQRLWEKVGGRSLLLSVGIHLTLFLLAGFFYLSYTENQRIDFLPGGGTQQGEQASQNLENQVNRKKTRWLNKKPPMQRIAVEKAMSSITLPDAKPELLDLPMTKDFLGAGKMGSLGFGTSGAGGGFGNGIGVGGKSGITFTPLSMFGKKIVGRRIAVVMDVSRSMTPYLEDVVKELDRVASGSPVILYYGCGLMPAGGEKIDETVQRTQAKDFERFWRIWQGNAMLGFSGMDLKKITFSSKDKIPMEDLYRFFARRNNTWFLDYNGMDFAWTALLCQEIRNADALYWFSDFEDNVSERQMKTVLDNLLVRRQRLYIHPQTHGQSFGEVVAQIVEPSGGDVVEPKSAKKK